MNFDASLKLELRRAALVRRAALPPAARAAFSERLTAEGGALARRLAACAVSAFYPVRDEPDTLALLALLAAEGVTTALPVTVASGAPLTFRRWRPGEPTVAGRMRIPEPPAEAASLDPDLLFVPLAAFDRRGHRIGYGGGHYDRTLARLRALKPITAVGIAYAAAEIAAVPDGPHDQRLDYVLTDSELIEIRAE